MSNEEIVKEIKCGHNTKENMLQLWNNMERLVTTIAREFKGYAEIEDLIQEGFLSLYDAIKNYDESKGVKFSNYAVYWFKMRMNRYICECTKAIRIPEAAEYTRRKYEKFILEYEKEHGKKPSKRHICKFLDVGIETLNKIEKNANLARITSTDKQIETEDGNSVSIIDTIAGPYNEDTIIEQIDNNILMADIWKIVDELPELEKDIIVARYAKEQNNKEIARENNISEKEVSRNYNRAIRKLRKKRYRIIEIEEGFYSEYFIAEAYQHIGVANYNRTWNSVTERVAIRL